MAEAFKSEEKKAPKESELIVPTLKAEPHTPLDTMSRMSSSTRPKDYSPTVAKAERDAVVLANREKFDSPANSVGKRFGSLMSQV